MHECLSPLGGHAGRAGLIAVRVHDPARRKAGTVCTTWLPQAGQQSARQSKGKPRNTAGGVEGKERARGRQGKVTTSPCESQGPQHDQRHTAPRILQKHKERSRRKQALASTGNH